jgi:hypothetical protein
VWPSNRREPNSNRWNTLTSLKWWILKRLKSCHMRMCFFIPLETSRLLYCALLLLQSYASAKQNSHHHIRISELIE